MAIENIKEASEQEPANKDIRLELEPREERVFEGDTKNVSLTVKEGARLTFRGNLKNGKITIESGAIVTVEGNAKNLRVSVLTRPGRAEGRFIVNGEKKNVLEKQISGDVSSDKQERASGKDKEREETDEGSEVEDGLDRSTREWIEESSFMSEAELREAFADPGAALYLASQTAGVNVGDADVLSRILRQYRLKRVREGFRIEPEAPEPTVKELGGGQGFEWSKEGKEGIRKAREALKGVTDQELAELDPEVQAKLLGRGEELEAVERRVGEAEAELAGLREGAGVGDEDLERVKSKEGRGFLGGWRKVKDGFLNRMVGLTSSAVALSKRVANKARLSQRLEAVRDFLGRRHVWAQEGRVVLEENFDKSADAPESEEGGTEPVEKMKKAAIAEVIEETEEVRVMKEEVESQAREILDRFKQKLEGSHIRDSKKAQNIFDSEVKDLLGPEGRVNLDLKFSKRESLSAEDLQNEINFMAAVNIQTAVFNAFDMVSGKEQSKVSVKIHNLLNSIVFDANGFRTFGNKSRAQTKKFFVNFLSKEYKDMNESDPKARALSEFLTKLKNKKVE